MERYYIHLIINKELYMDKIITEDIYYKTEEKIMRNINGLLKDKRKSK